MAWTPYLIVHFYCFSTLWVPIQDHKIPICFWFGGNDRLVTLVFLFYRGVFNWNFLNGTNLTLGGFSKIFENYRKTAKRSRASVHFDRFALIQFFSSWWEPFCHFEILEWKLFRTKVGTFELTLYNLIFFRSIIFTL